MSTWRATPSSWLCTMNCLSKAGSPVSRPRCPMDSGPRYCWGVMSISGMTGNDDRATETGEPCKPLVKALPTENCRP